MLESLRKTVLASLGMVAFTKEKLEETFNEMVQRGELTKDQAKALLKVLLERGDHEGKQLVERLSREVDRVLALGPLATRNELRSLQERLAELERRMAPDVPEESASSTS